MSRSFNWLFKEDTQDYESLRKKTEETLHSAILEAEAGNWEAVIEAGLFCPLIMDDILKAYYPSLPERMRYTLPLKWYMGAGKASKTVCEAVKYAVKYKPANWLGKGLVKGDWIEVYCALRSGNSEEAKACLSWCTNYTGAYITAQKINGKIFKGQILKENILAFDESCLEGVIQYNSVYAVQQIYPVLPLSACK